MDVQAAKGRGRRSRWRTGSTRSSRSIPWRSRTPSSETNIPKVDDWGDYLYIVFRVPRIDPGADALELNELDVFLGPNYLVTFHVAPMAILDAERAGIARDPRDRLRHGPDHLLFRVLELAVDESLASIEELDDRVDTLQDSIIERPSPDVIRRIFRIKRSAIQLHKTLGPQREVLNRLARDPYSPILDEHRVYFRDLYDHVVRIHDISESLRDLIAGTLETYLSVLSNRTNEIMKTLTIVTVMFLPMSFLTSFFGMNFFGEPLVLEIHVRPGLLFAATGASWRYRPVSCGFTRSGSGGSECISEGPPKGLKPTRFLPPPRSCIADESRKPPPSHRPDRRVSWVRNVSYTSPIRSPTADGRSHRATTPEPPCRGAQA